MAQDAAALLVRIEATTAQLRAEMKRADAAVGNATKNIDGQLSRADRAFDRLNRSSAGALGEIGKNFDLLSLSVKAATATMAAFGVGASFTRFIANTQNAEKEQAQLAAVLRSTGEAAGYSADQLNDMSTRMAKSTTYAAGAVTTAQTAMLAFTGIVGDEFTRAMDSAANMSARTGMSLAQTAELIGRALDVPSQGMASLSRQGFRFSEDQRELMKQLEATGKTAEAQGIILAALEESYGGAAAAARDTLAGALTALTNSFDDLLTGSDNALSGVTKAVNAVNAALSKPEARMAISALGDALIAVSAIMAGRVVAAGTSAAGAFLAAQVQALRYQAALASMAGVSRNAAIAMTASATAARTASAAMALLGGPVGAAVVAASAVGYFATRSSEAEREADALDARIQKLDGSFQSLSANQAAAAILDYESKLSSANMTAEAAAAKVFTLNDNISRFPGSPKQEQWRQELIRASAALDTANQVVDGHREKITQLTAVIDQNTTSRQGNNLASLEGIEAGEKYLKQLETQLNRMKDKTAVQAAERVITENQIDRQSELGQKILATAAAQDAQREADAKLTGSIKTGNKALDDRIKAIDALRDKYNPASKAQAEYEKGIELADEALRKNKYTTEQYQKVVQGLYTDLNKPIWDKHNKQAKEAADAIKKIDDQLESVRDRLDPVRAATKRLTAEKKLLKEGLDAGSISLEEYTQNVALLEKEYDDNIRATSEWAKWTEGALDRVDSAFADAWRNIGDGFSSFRDSLTNAFKQMLAELAHMAITKPIIMQIGAAMGIGGAAGQATAMLGGGAGSGGGINMGSMLQFGQSAYSMLTGVGPAALAGWQSGGIGGAMNGIGGYYGGMIGNAASTVGGWLGMGGASSAAPGVGYAYGQSLVSGQIGSAAYAGASAGSSGVLSGITGMLSNPVTWIGAGLAASWKLYGAGYRADGGQMRDTWSNTSGIGGELGNSVSFLSSVYEKHDKIVGSVIGDKLANVLSGGPLVQYLGTAIHRLFGSGERFKTTVGSATGGYAGGEYTSTGPSATWFPGSRKFGAEHDATLDDLNAAFNVALGGLFDAFEVDSSIATTARTRLRRTSGAMIGDFITDIDGEITKFYRSYSKDAKIGEAFTQYADDIMGEYLAKSIVSSDLPEYFRQQFEPLANNKTTAEDVANKLADIFGRFESVNSILETVNLTALELTDAGMRASDALIALSGGMDALQASYATYYDPFFTAAEKTEDTINAITKAFEAADVTLAGSRSEYRAMVENIDLTTEAGREMFATLMALSGQAATYYSTLEQQLMGGVNNAYASLQRSIANQQREIQQQASIAASSISALTGISNSLDAALKKLRGTSDDTVRSLRAQAVMTLNSALVQARSGQSLAGFEGLQDALDTASQMDTALYASLVDFEREQGRTANLVAELEKVIGKDLRVDQDMLRSLESQLSALDRQLEAAQSQLDALNGIDNSVMTVAAAIAALNSSIVSALSALQAGAAKANTPANNGIIVDSIYKELFGRDADQAGRDYWTGQLGSGAIDYSGAVGAIGSGAQGSDLAALIGGAYQSTLGRDADAGGAAYWEQQISAGNLSYVDLQDALKAAAKAAGEIPAFAAGGFHSGGLRLVGENGPELEVTGPSRIYNASQTAAMLGGGDSTAAITSLQRTVEGQSAALRSIAKHTMQTAKRVEFLERWDFDGLPKERAIA